MLTNFTVADLLEEGLRVFVVCELCGRASDMNAALYNDDPQTRVVEWIHRSCCPECKSSRVSVKMVSPLECPRGLPPTHAAEPAA